MRKSNIKILIFNMLLIIIFLLSNFIPSILSYYNLVIFFVITLIIYKLIFGFEKDNHRYLKDIIYNIIIILLIFFIVYYLFGLIISFVRTKNYYTIHGFKDLIIPYSIIIILKEYLRYQLLCKVDKNKKLTILTTITFIVIDIAGYFRITTWTSNYDVFIFFSMTLLPAISKNVTCTYISKKVGYKPNLLWLLVIDLYGSLLPIVPNTGLYVGSMINFLFPLIILYNVYTFYNSREEEVPTRDKDKTTMIYVPTFTVFVLTILYFTSGYFKYYTIAIATGSMTPNINKGDIVVINQKCKLNELQVGDVIAYEYNGRIIVHRIVEIDKVDKELYFYTKGDANNRKDSYIIYENMIRGVVKNKISYLGLPTVWIREL